MPHSTLKLQPGVDQNRTLALNEAAISNTQLVRFIPDKQGLGLVQKLGGWVKYFNSSITTIVRALWAWEDTNAITYLAVGCEGNSLNGNGLSVIYNGSRQVITPQFSALAAGIATTAASSNTPFYYSITTATTAGTTATVTFTGYHYFKIGDYIYINGNSVANYNTTQIVTGVTYNTVSFTIASGTANGSGGTITYASGIQTNAGSANVIINIPNSNLNNYSSVYFKTPMSVGGLVISGLYQATYLSINSFQITVTDVLGNPKPATSTVSTFP